MVVEKEGETIVVTATPAPMMEEEPALGSQFLGVYEGPEDSSPMTDQFPTQFNEAPELAAMVAAGELPSVEDRLPVTEDLLVYQPLHEIGQYGGTWHRGFCSTR